MRLQASKAHIWAKEDGCTGYTRLYSSARPETERDMSAANEGIEAHNVAAEVLRVPTTTGEGEMYEYAHLYADIVYGHLTDDSELIIEEKVSMPFADDVTPIVDAASFDPKTKILRVYEYKYGTSPVEVVRNPQLMLGALGLIAKHGWKVDIIELYVYQPRAFHRDGELRDWHCDDAALKEFEGIAMMRYVEYKEGLATCRTGNHCLKCPAMLKCHAHTNSTMACVDYTEMPESWDRDAESIGAEYKLVKRIAKQLEKRVEALKVECEHLTAEGEHTGYYLGERSNPLKWNRSAAEMIDISKALGVDIAKAPTILTPKQVLDKKILTEEQLLNFAGRPSPSKVLKELDGDTLKERLK